MSPDELAQLEHLLVKLQSLTRLELRPVLRNVRRRLRYRAPYASGRKRYVPRGRPNGGRRGTYVDRREWLE